MARRFRAGAIDIGLGAEREILHSISSTPMRPSPDPVRVQLRLGIRDQALDQLAHQGPQSSRPSVRNIVVFLA